MGPWRGLPAAFQILFELIAASFKTLIKKQLVEEFHRLHQCRFSISNEHKNIGIQTELVYPLIHVW